MTPEERAAEAMLCHTDPYKNCEFYLPADLEGRIAAQIRDAVAAERERCARIADVKVERPDDETAAEAAREIAARIRRGEQ